MRLDKFLSEMGMGTRNELKKAIRGGHVAVDGTVITDPGARVTDQSYVTLRGEPVEFEKFAYYMLNKPAGIISASEDPREKTVVDLIEGYKRKDLFPAGRLDRDTEGLLLITNDGELAHRLLSPKHHVDKLYFARLSPGADEGDALAFSRGLKLPDGLECMPAELEMLNEKGDEVLIRIREGKFHQIKRMFAARGKEVIYLKRLEMGPLSLDPDLEAGSYRRLTDEEIKLLKEV